MYSWFCFIDKDVFFYVALNKHLLSKYIGFSHLCVEIDFEIMFLFSIFISIFRIYFLKW